MTDQYVLVVDDEEIARQNLVHVLTREGLNADCAVDGDQAARMLAERRYQLVLTDLRMPGLDGLSLLHLIKERWPDTEVIVITAHASTESAVDAMRAGAFYYVEKPYRLAEVRKVVKEALEKAALRSENAALKTALSLATGKSRIVTNSPLMEDLLVTATRVAPTDCNVLIHGETGTGKEVMARHLHDHSRRAAAPFVALNCGALAEDLLANELFGHERGAFTGASTTKGGLLEAAAGGTLFLDEVTEMSPAIQVKLLRLLQEREFFRVGGTETIKADIRIVAATNRDPAQAVAEGRLRQDLYFRLNVVSLHIPPLRERRGDIPMLASHFMSKAAHRMNKRVSEIDPEAFDCLLAYGFPGNIRELENLMERAVALAESEVITADLLPEAVRGGKGQRSVATPDSPILPLAEIERQHIMRALDHTQGNRALAAQLLGIDRVSLWRKLRAYREA
ncbi:MAG TPA: sigma-54 dependent transcriptional regulator [Rhodocyclaceae bacterium]|nr:sigma-54 dependent transcriptional regulator [Rhodocyclaceae bacterium]